jgi:REP element-mobilizing transposase RayT
MPCYLFTYHAHGSWLPDRPLGYVRRGKGILPTDMRMADRYRKNSKYDNAQFLEPQQLAAIEVLQEAVGHIGCHLHFVATDATHLHVLVSWKDDRTWQQNRASLKKTMTISFKERFGMRPWFVENASRRQVRDRKHFEYLITKYLPSHAGWKWCERRGLFKDRPARRSSPANTATRQHSK